MTKIMYLITIMITLEASDKSKFGKELLTNYLKIGSVQPSTEPWFGPVQLLSRKGLWTGVEPDESSDFLWTNERVSQPKRHWA